MRARFCWVMLVTACGGSGRENLDPDAGSLDAGGSPDAGAPDLFELQPECGFPLGPNGEIAVPDTAVAPGGEGAIIPVRIKNVGGEWVERLRYEITGPNASELSVETQRVDLQDSDACARVGDPFELGVGASCRIDLRFKPTSPGAKQAQIVINDSSTFEIRGTALATPTGLYATSSSFFVRTKPTLFESPFYLINGGTQPIELGEPTLTAPFQLASGGWNCPSPLTPGTACLVDRIAMVDPTAIGCPTGTFSTTTGAIAVPLHAPRVLSTLHVQVNTAGAVHIAPTDQTCASPDGQCVAQSETSTDFTLTATPAAGGHFRNWFGADEQTPSVLCGTEPVCAIPGGFVHQKVGAHFASAEAKAISVTIEGTGTVSTSWGSCSSSCTLYAEPNEHLILNVSGGSFIEWTGACVGGPSTACDLGTIIDDRTVTARFAP